jgi:tryptophan halogenase
VSDDRVRSIVIMGAGAPVWLAAAILARVLKRPAYRITVIEPPGAAPVGHSYAALPAFHRLNALLGINEADLVRQTQATFRLGTRFEHWGRPGDRYFHGFGSIGARLDGVPFHHHWVRLQGRGAVGALEEFSTAAQLARRGRFAPPLADAHSVLSLYSYAYHFDAQLLAAYLRQYAEAHGAVHLDREVREVQLRGEDGFITALRLDDGSLIEADLYIDVIGAEGSEREKWAGSAAKREYEDWGRWLLCDRAVTLSSNGAGDLPPYSEASARSFGWQWRVPLRGRVDSGYAFCSELLSDDAAAKSLVEESVRDERAAPRVLRFLNGRPKQFWAANGLTLPGCALQPLESTALHLVQTGITRLLTLFPVSRFSPKDLEEYNRLTALEYERIRDFLILHFKATTRSDSPFWDHCRNMDVPDTLRSRIELFERSGRIRLLEEEHFSEDNWLAVLTGQNLRPQSYDPLADVADAERLRAAFDRMRAAIGHAVETLPTHSRFLDALCAGETGKSS